MLICPFPIRPKERMERTVHRPANLPNASRSTAVSVSNDR
jgi:hypothetical protein